MCEYRIGEICCSRPVVIYEYQKERNASHPREFLKGYKGTLVCDVYQVYHTLSKERPDDLTISGCWIHARRHFTNAIKALKIDPKGTLAYDAAERAVRGFCIGKKNWEMIDTMHGATASAMLYSLVDTSKANNLKIYEYLKYLLSEIPKHVDQTDTDFIENLLPWSDNLPEECRKTKN